ncbi:hypothetical protein SO802_011184 [Lithocarpus litseifolius]|uniref:Uncharacterized protein n=1 Tax=Lithocarpus litseifolius TaxID=425828 RepID=A0AAW2D1Q7_9ROSI
MGKEVRRSLIPKAWVKTKVESSLSQVPVEVPLPTTGKILKAEVVTVSSAGFPGVREEAPGGGITEETEQPMQGFQSAVPLAVQDLEASQPEQTFSPTKTLSPDPMLSKELLGGASLSPSISLPSFSHFAKVSSPFLHITACSFTESSKKSEEREEEASPKEADSGVRDPEFMILEAAMGSAQVTKSQARTPQTTQKGDSSLVPTGKDATMAEASEVAISDLDSGLSAFLARFDLLEFNSLPASHFHSFRPSYGNFLRFSVPVEGLPLLEGLLKVHGNFTSGFRRGVFLSNILMELLCAMLISLRDSSLDSLSEEKLLEWRGVVQDLLEAKFNLYFLLEHLRSLAFMLFQRQASKSIDVEIAAAEEALARAHKVLQDLKVKRQRVLSSSAVPAISLDSSLLTSLIP